MKNCCLFTDCLVLRRKRFSTGLLTMHDFSKTCLCRVGVAIRNPLKAVSLLHLYSLQTGRAILPWPVLCCERLKPWLDTLCFRLCCASCTWWHYFLLASLTLLQAALEEAISWHKGLFISVGIFLVQQNLMLDYNGNVMWLWERCVILFFNYFFIL